MCRPIAEGRVKKPEGRLTWLKNLVIPNLTALCGVSENTFTIS